MVKNYAIYLLAFFLLLNPGEVFAQQPMTYKADPGEAEKAFKNRNYTAALKIYLLLLKKEPKNKEYNLKAAACYVLSNSIKAKAIPYVEFLLKEEPVEPEVYYYAGMAYHFANRFDDAIKMYTLYKQKKPKEADEMDQRIQQCYNGKELIKNPLTVTFENLGKEVNTEFPDFYPFVTPDDQTLAFTSRRKSPTAAQPEFDGLYPSDIFMITKKPDGKWSKPQPMGTNINTKLDEEVTCLTPDGGTMLFYIDHIDVFGDIWQSKKLNNKGQFLASQRLNDTVNAGIETAAYIWKHPEGDEGDLLFFASSRSGNYGMTDIYFCRRLPTGNWGFPQNLGNKINTKFKEDFPIVSPDGKTLYFASQGHSSMGGFDIFKCVWDEEAQAWSSPRNMGYPINTADDNLVITFIDGGRVGYMTAMREEGLGDLDIYRVTLEDVEGKETIYRGFILAGDSGGAKIKDATISVENKKTKELYGTYIPEKNKGYYVMALPPGKWIVNIEAEGYMIHTEEIVVFDYTGFKPEIVKDFKLKK
ncbi:MAG: hypothetical protein AB1458_16400 [Bacteroidota bacterium]